MRWTPATAPTANTTACTASSATVAAEGASSSAAASTSVVSVAANRGPRGSIWVRATGGAVVGGGGHVVSCGKGRPGLRSRGSDTSRERRGVRLAHTSDSDEGGVT